ncbi:MAG TPA: hypothetical protein VK929_15300 [Longimicrobiales bacterium]|nr:hypothetical protein [Longimicrobiales bacterium]
MAQIKVERAKRGFGWIWLVAAVVLVIAAVLLLDYAGYINLPFRLGAADITGGTATVLAGAVPIAIRGRS